MVAIGRVHLSVKDIDRVTTFYRERVGLAVRAQAPARVTLGVADADLLVLHAMPDGKHYARTTGLYHFALLLPTRRALANALTHLAHTGTHLQGASDHVVSEALYLPDPEANGIEIYHDRPRDAWYKDGQFQLATLSLDVDNLLAERDPARVAALPPSTRVGHVHLHVGDVAAAEAFYTGLLGMDVMMNVGTATFLSYDGYHHHLGANVWSGTALPPADALGLVRWELNLGAERLAAVRARLAAAGTPITEDGGRLLVDDPWRNTVSLGV